MTANTILLDHGGGGKLSHRLIAETIAPAFASPFLANLNDAAVLEIGGKRLAFSTDSYTVDPLRFPGGDIGELAVYGTVNDIAMCGGEPLYLSLGLIIEEGFPITELEDILQSIAGAAKKAGVMIVTGDTKVVPHGAADKLFINTAGIGLVPDQLHLGGQYGKAGDVVLLSGTIADHGMTIITQREGVMIASTMKSDTAPLNHMVRRMLAASNGVHVLRDPTRGGLGTALNEIAIQSQIGIRIHESRIPVKPDVAAACELLGFDPLYVANEGKLIALVAAEDAEKTLQAMQADEFGQSACIIGEATSAHRGKVYLATEIGGARIIDMLVGEQLPRIC